MPPLIDGERVRIGQELQKFFLGNVVCLVTVERGIKTRAGTPRQCYVVDLIAGDSFDSDTRSLLALGIATAIATILARGYQAGKLIAAKYNIKLPDQPLR